MSPTMRMTEHEYRWGTVVTLAVDGEPAEVSAQGLDEWVERAARQHGAALTEIRLDLTGTAGLSAEGLRGLMVAHQRIGRRVRIVLAGVGPEAAESIRRTGVDRVVVVEESDEL